MLEDELIETRGFWNRVAGDWDIQVGDEGDNNRILNSDPVLWSFAGDVSRRDVLDAGCGVGYLSRKLHQRGANVIGVDFSERMIAIAKAKAPGIDFRVESCSELASVPNASMDVVIANYVLMDTPDLDGTMKTFHRVLRVGGITVLVFSHPCFPQGRAERSVDGVTYYWDHSYFDQCKRVDPPWGHFTSDFIWFHRPLSDYWKAFVRAGFDVVDLEEPRVTAERYPLAKRKGVLENSRRRPYSIAFKLRKK